MFTFTTKHDDNDIEMALALSEVMRGNYAQLHIGAPPPPATTDGNEQMRSMWEEEVYLHCSFISISKHLGR